MQGEHRPERAGDRPLVPEPGRLGHEDRGPHRAHQGEHGRDHHPGDGAEAGMWGRVATRSSTHLPAAVATERDWGDAPLPSRQRRLGGLGSRRLPAIGAGIREPRFHAPRRVQGGLLRHGDARCSTRFAGQMAQQRALSARKPVACDPERDKSDTTETPKPNQTPAVHCRKIPL